MSSNFKFNNSDGRHEVSMAIERYALSLFDGQYFRKTSHSLDVQRSEGLYLETSFLLSLLIPSIQSGCFLFLISGLSWSCSHLKNLSNTMCLLFQVPIHLWKGSSSSDFLNRLRYEKTSSLTISLKSLKSKNFVISIKVLILPFLVNSLMLISFCSVMI